MIIFDPEDPFPLLPTDSFSYSDAKTHSEQVDAWLGFQSQENKLQFTASHEVWSGLPLQSLQTPYVEIRACLAELNLAINSAVIDCGCAYGRMALVIARHHSDLQFIGYEIEPARANEANRLLALQKTSNAKIIKQDLEDPSFELPKADCYFIYDFGTEVGIRAILMQMKAHARMKNILVVGRGRRTRQILHLEHPWLTEVHPPKHFLNFSIYQS